MRIVQNLENGRREIQIVELSKKKEESLRVVITYDNQNIVKTPPGQTHFLNCKYYYIDLTLEQAKRLHEEISKFLQETK